MYYKPNMMLCMDTDDINTAQKIWMFNINGIGHSKTGINGIFGTAITMDGHIVADFVDTGTLTANIIKAGTMHLSRLYGDDLILGGNGNGRGRLIIKDSSAVDKIVADNNGISLLNGSKLIGGNGVLSNFQFQDQRFCGVFVGIRRIHQVKASIRC